MKSKMKMERVLMLLFFLITFISIINSLLTKINSSEITKPKIEDISISKEHLNYFNKNNSEPSLIKLFVYNNKNQTARCDIFIRYGYHNGTYEDKARDKNNKSLTIKPLFNKSLLFELEYNITNSSCSDFDYIIGYYCNYISN